MMGFTSSSDIVHTSTVRASSEAFRFSVTTAFGSSFTAFGLRILVRKRLLRSASRTFASSHRCVHFGCQISRLAIDPQLNQHTDQVADHPVKHKSAWRRQEEQPRQHN